MSEILEILSNNPRGCGCHSANAETPVLDVRTIPHQIRHAAIIGAFNVISPGASLILMTPHKPLPLLIELEQRFPIDVEYLQEDPEEWRLKITRR